MSNNSYSIGDNHIDWSGDFTKVRLADRFDVIWMAASTLMNLVSHLSLREDNNDRGVVYDKLFKEDTVYQKYREGILFQKGGTAIFFSYDVFEKLIINFSQAQGKIKEISCALTSSGYLIGNGPVVFSSWQMEAIYANMRNAEIQICHLVIHISSLIKIRLQLVGKALSLSSMMQRNLLLCWITGKSK